MPDIHIPRKNINGLKLVTKVLEDSESRSNTELGNYNGAHRVGGLTDLKYIGCDQLKCEQASRGLKKSVQNEHHRG